MMTTTIDLEPSARHVAQLISRIPDEMLVRRTPCEDYSLGDLLDHLDNSVRAFTEAARKTGSDPELGRPGDQANLDADWRITTARNLAALVVAWRDPEAWSGMTQAAGIDVPGEVAGRIALDELTIHGWDIAQASGQRFEVDEASLRDVHDFVQQFAEPGQEASREGLFGPVVPVAADAPLLDRVLAMTGRDPRWTA
jgi:uncharacterized protein (TIGR03086 family)